MSDLKLKEEYDYYIANYESFKNEFAGMFIVIKNKKILGTYANIEDALKETLKTEDAGTFLIQFCDGNDVVTTQTFHSRVRFH